MNALKRRASRGLAIASLWLAAAIAHAGTVHYHYTDAQGTTLATADAQGVIVSTNDYAPYGSAVPNMSAAPDGPGYTGHVNDPDTGLVYMQARYYDPAVGRFLSVDPVGPTSANFFNFNRYDYTNNNPINHTDPTGRVVNIADNEQTILKLINSRAAGKFIADKQGNLQATKAKGDASKYSTTYSNALKQAINSKYFISISIGSTYKDKGNNKNVDKDSGGGVTIGSHLGGTQNIVISGNSNNSLKDVSGGQLRDSPADILSHELVGHAIPHIAGGGTGNAVMDENKVRSEIPGSGQRAAESHKE